MHFKKWTKTKGTAILIYLCKRENGLLLPACDGIKELVIDLLRNDRVDGTGYINKIWLANTFLAEAQSLFPDSWCMQSDHFKFCHTVAKYRYYIKPNQKTSK